MTSNVVTSSHGQKCANLFYKSEDLKKTLGKGQKNLLKDSLSWQKLNEFIEINKKLLLIDLDYALEKKSEVELWNIAFKEVINTLQSEANSRSILDKSKKSDAQVNLTWFLDFASGFYVLLLQETCVNYDLDLPFLRSAGFYGVASDLEASSIDVKKCNNVSNVNYICAHCLVHLGDLARYRGQTKQAETFYKHSLKVAPASGHAYNQLALLEVSKGSTLTSVFFYVRALALKCPFPAASSNLAKMYSKILSSAEDTNFTSKFLALQACLHSAVKLKKAKEVANDLCEHLNELVASEAVKVKDMIKCVSILMFHLSNTSNESDLSTEEKIIYRVQVGLISGFFNAFLMPVHSMKDGFLDWIGLPMIKLILDWIILNPESLKNPGFLCRQQVWPALSKLLNDLKKVVVDGPNEENENSRFPLPEEFDLQAFLPLSERLQNYNFRQLLKGCTLDVKVIKMLRCQRILQQGQILANDLWPSRKVLEIKGDTFEAIDEIIPNEFIENLEKDLKIEDEVEIHQPFQTAAAKKKSKNVAMEAILRQASESSKQVTFKTPSPNFSEDSNSQPSSTISQEDSSQHRNVPAYLTPNRASLPNMPPPNLPIRMDFSVPPPPIRQPFFNQQQNPWNPRPLVDPAAVAATFRGPSYQLFAGNGPAWSLSGNQQQPPRPPNATGGGQQNFLFQPGPSPLEKLLQQKPPNR